MDLTQLTADLKADDDALRASAAEQLARAGEAAQPAAFELVCATSDDDSTVRDWAVAALEGLGPPSRESIPRLAELLSDPRLDVAYWAATLLGRLRATAGSFAGATAALASALDSHPEVPVRQRAAWALGQIGPATNQSDTLAALKRASSDPDARLARLASQALQQITSN